MAISPIVIAWLSHLRSRDILKGGRILELGPSDLILYTPAAVEFYVRRHLSAQDSRAVMDDLFDSRGLFRSERIRALYGVFGYTTYRSIDLGDARADWRFDLNHPVDVPERFDLIANFGTAEHVFNIGEVFRTVHTLLVDGGVALHIMPVLGDVNHGFYNIHPTVYFDLARANDYVVEDFRYIDHIDWRTSEHTARFKNDIDFDALPIGRTQLEAHSTLGAEIDRNIGAVRKRRPESIAKDYAFVAMRKVLDRAFRFPTQSVYASPPPATGCSAGGQADVEAARVERLHPLLPRRVQRFLRRLLDPH